MEPSEYDLIAAVQDRHWWYLGMRAVAEALLSGPAAARSLASGPSWRILDAGCGPGGALSWLAHYGSVVGLDYHPRALFHAARRSTCVCRASVLEIPFQSGTFDLVTCQDVLYHQAVTDDVRAMREFARVLRPGGWLLATVPAYDWLRGAHDRQVHTRHRYAAGELRGLVRTAGLELVRLTGAASAVLAPAIIRRWSQGRSGAPRSDVSMPSPAFNRLATVILRAEARWLARHELPFGLQWAALARRPA
jgi:SAM-dependent methyltransferase